MEEYLRTRDVSRISGYTKKVIRRFVQSGELKAYRRAKNCDLRFKLSDVKNFIEGRSQAKKKKGQSNKKQR